jgi:hypothetical protein
MHAVVELKAHLVHCPGAEVKGSLWLFAASPHVNTCIHSITRTTTTQIDCKPTWHRVLWNSNGRVPVAICRIAHVSVLVSHSSQGVGRQGAAAAAAEDALGLGGGIISSR